MISHKTKIILIVIFDIIINCNGVEKDTADPDFDERTKKLIKECEAVFTNVGFISDAGFYNLNFVLQFKDFTEFIEYVKTKIDITSYTNVALAKEPDNKKLDTQDNLSSTIKSDKKTTGDLKIEVIDSNPEETEKNTASTTNSKKRKLDTMTDDSVILPEEISYLRTIYYLIVNDKINRKEADALMTPKAYCLLTVKILSDNQWEDLSDNESNITYKSQNETLPIKKRKLFGINFAQFFKIIGKKDTAIKAEETPSTLTENTKLATIEEERTPDEICADSILKYQYESKQVDKVYKYDEDNQYKDIITSYDIYNFKDPVNDEKNVFNMEGIPDLCNYYTYHRKLILLYADEYKMFKTAQLCTNYFSKNNEESKENH